MVYPVIEPKALLLWQQQLAGILPLTALIEFTNVPSKLHSLELAAAVPLWSWPVTPAGARLLLSSEDNTNECCLDHTSRSQVLHCIDGRYGDLYPSSAPTTAQLILKTCAEATVVENKSPNILHEQGRKQKLDIIVILPLKERPSSRLAAYLDPWLSLALRWNALKRLRYMAVTVSGWAFWIGSTVVCLMGSLYIAAAYLILMPLTGCLVSFLHGGRPRQLNDNRPPEYSRMVIATNSLNGCDWRAFYGGSYAVNSLLNKPLCRSTPLPSSHAICRMLLRVFIVGQWVLAVGSCAVQDWNAFIITIWLFYCVYVSAYLYPLEKCVRDWLEDPCCLSVKRIQVQFSTRRSLLSALVFLNPDTQQRNTKWIDPILKQSEDREKWESALLEYIRSGKIDEKAAKHYWWKFIEEGIDMGKKLKPLLPPNKFEAEV